MLPIFYCRKMDVSDFLTDSNDATSVTEVRFVSVLMVITRIVRVFWAEMVSGVLRGPGWWGYGGGGQLQVRHYE